LRSVKDIRRSPRKMKAVFVLILAAIISGVVADIPDWCYDQKEVETRSKNADSTKRCEFYTACLEAKYNCNSGAEASRYPVDYGLKYCVKFGQKSFQSQKGRDWRDATLTCLQASFFKGGYMEKGTNKGNCQALTDYEFGEHARCYTQPGASICELARPSPSDGGLLGRAEDAASIALTVDGKDLMSVRSGKQILQVLGTCSDQILKYTWDKMKSAGHFLADEAGKLYDAAASGLKKAGQKIVQGGKWVGNKISDGWNAVTGLFRFKEARRKLHALQKQRHLMAPEHAERLDRLTERMEALAREFEAMEKNNNADELAPNF